jgi:8-oxo-dGTP diphosphatase
MTGRTWESLTMDDVVDAQRLAAYGIAVDGGRILLARASGRSDFPGTWSLPGGGVDHGEHPVDTVMREFIEETGLTVRVEGPCTVYSDEVEIPSRRLRLHSVRLCYSVTVVGGDLRDETDGSTDLVRWVDVGEARRLNAMAPFVASAIEQVRSLGAGA